MTPPPRGPRRPLASPCLAALLLAAACRCQAGPDVLDLIQPGDPTDVVAGGLALPGRYASRPDLSQPLSLLEYPSSLALGTPASHPVSQTGASQEKLTGLQCDGVLSLRLGRPEWPWAAAARVQRAASDLREGGANWSHAALGRNLSEVAVAGARGPVRIGLSLQNGQQEGDLASSRLAGIAASPGDGFGLVGWRYRHGGATLEAEGRIGTTGAGLLASGANGTWNADSIIGGQSYAAQLDATACRVAPYVALRHGRSTDLLVLGLSHQSGSGPVLYGQLEAGSARAEASGYRAAWARIFRPNPGRRIFSVEVAGLDSRLRASAGGFILPGIFSTSYAAAGSFSWHRVAVRYGYEHRWGPWALRGSLMAAGGLADGTLRSTEARWLTSPTAGLDERIDHAGVWLLSPGIGAGYAEGRWTADAGLWAFAGGLAQRHHAGSTSGTPTPGHGSSRLQPGLAAALVVRREL